MTTNERERDVHMVIQKSDSLKIPKSVSTHLLGLVRPAPGNHPHEMKAFLILSILRAFDILYLLESSFPQLQLILTYALSALGLHPYNTVMTNILSYNLIFPSPLLS